MLRHHPCKPLSTDVTGTHRVQAAADTPSRGRTRATRWYVLLVALWCFRVVLSLGTGNPYDGHKLRDGAEWVASSLLGVKGWVPVQFRRLGTENSLGAFSDVQAPAIETGSLRVEGALQLLNLEQGAQFGAQQGSEVVGDTLFERSAEKLAAWMLFCWPWLLATCLLRPLYAAAGAALSPRLLHQLPSVAFMQPLIALFEWALWSCLDSIPDASSLRWLYIGTIWSWPSAVLLLQPSKEAFEVLAVLSICMWHNVSRITGKASLSAGNSFRKSAQLLERLCLFFAIYAACVSPSSMLYTLPLFAVAFSDHQQTATSARVYRRRPATRRSGFVLGFFIVLRTLAALADVLANRIDWQMLAEIASHWTAVLSVQTFRMGMLGLWRFQYRYRLDFVWNTLPWMLGPHALSVVYGCFEIAFGERRNRCMLHRSSEQKRPRSSLRRFSRPSPKGGTDWRRPTNIVITMAEPWLWVALVGLACYSVQLERDWPRLVAPCLGLVMFSLLNAQHAGAGALRSFFCMIVVVHHVLVLLFMIFCREAGLALLPMYLFKTGLQPEHVIYVHTDMPPRVLFTGPLASVQVHHLRAPSPAFLHYYTELELASSIAVRAYENASTSLTTDAKMRTSQASGDTVIAVPRGYPVPTNWSQLYRKSELFPHWSAHLSIQGRRDEALRPWIRSRLALDVYWRPTP